MEIQWHYNERNNNIFYNIFNRYLMRKIYALEEGGTREMNYVSIISRKYFYFFA